MIVTIVQPGLRAKTTLLQVNKKGQLTTKQCPIISPNHPSLNIGCKVVDLQGDLYTKTNKGWVNNYGTKLNSNKVYYVGFNG